MAVTRKEAKTGLKDTDYAVVVNVDGRGVLRAVRWEDKDTLAQNDTLRITIDGDVVLDAEKDVESAEILDLLQSILTDSIDVTTDEKLISNQRIPFHKTLEIAYKRAAAGDNGLDITTVYEVKSYF